MRRGRLFRVFAYAMIALWGLIIAAVALSLCLPLEDQIPADDATLRPAVPTAPPGDYSGGPAACTLLEEVRNALLDGDLDDNELRRRLDDVQLSTAPSEPMLQSASKRILATVDLGDVGAFLDAIEVMAEICVSYGYLDPS